VKLNRPQWTVVVRAFGLIVGLGIGLLCTAAFHPSAFRQHRQALLVEQDLQQLGGIGSPIASPL